MWGFHDCTCGFKCKGHLCVHWTSSLNCALKSGLGISLFTSNSKHVKQLEECFGSKRCKQKFLTVPLWVFFIHRSMWRTLRQTSGMGIKKRKHIVMTGREHVQCSIKFNFYWKVTFFTRTYPSILHPPVNGAGLFTFSVPLLSPNDRFWDSNGIGATKASIVCKDANFRSNAFAILIGSEILTSSKSWVKMGYSKANWNSWRSCTLTKLSVSRSPW